jgi:hypothetical protein
LDYHIGIVSEWATIAVRAIIHCLPQTLAGPSPPHLQIACIRRIDGMLIRRCVEVACFERGKVHSVRRFFRSEPLGPISIPTPRRHTCFCFVHVPFPKGWPLYCATFALQKVWLKLSWCAKTGFLQSALYCMLHHASFFFLSRISPHYLQPRGEGIN